ncbi:hypothetical protein EON76_03760 [bacterium]|nr:MAG: hypothetical protein EON76_03760 [bacterium]
MKRFKALVLSAFAVALVGAVGVAPSTYADVASGKADIGAGSGIKFGTQPVGAVNTCTLAAIGYDQQNNLVGISVGHCPTNTGGSNTAIGQLNDPTWAQVSGQKDAALGPVGTVVKKEYTELNDNAPDYSVILFDKNKVNPLKTVGSTTLYGIATTPPSIFQNVCKEGRTTAQTCGIVTNVTANYFDSFAFASGGDSGSPVVKTSDGKLAGYLTGGVGTTRYKYIQPVLNRINSLGGVGSGFHL